MSSRRFTVPRERSPGSFWQSRLSDKTCQISVPNCPPPPTVRIYRCPDTKSPGKNAIERIQRKKEKNMETNMKELNQKELSLEELEQVNGGWWPVIIAAAAAGYCFYEAYKKGKKAGWK